MMLVSALALAVTACSLGPAYKKPQTDTPAAWRGPAGAAGWPAADWWRGFNSPQLNDLIAQAQAANFDLGAAMARVREADAQARIAGAALLPSVGLSAQAVHERQPSPRNGLMATSTSVKADCETCGRRKFMAASCGIPSWRDRSTRQCG